MGAYGFIYYWGTMKVTGRFIDRAIGLMFKPKQSIVFELPKTARVSIHTAFVFYSIDVFYFDTYGRLMETKRNLKPFSYYRPRNEAKFILETPSAWKQNITKL